MWTDTQFSSLPLFNHKVRTGSPEGSGFDSSSGLSTWSLHVLLESVCLFVFPYNTCTSG